MALPAVSFRNLGNWDRLVRLGVGLALLSLGGFGVLPDLGSIALLLFGWIPALTAVLGWDPIYSLLHFTTAKR